MLERGNGTDLMSDELDELFFDVLNFLVGLEYNKSDGNLPFKFFHFGNNSSLRHSRMPNQHFLHLSRRQPMPGSINNIIQPGHDIEIPIIIIVAGIAGRIVPGGLTHILIQEGLVVAVKREHEGWRHGELDTDFA
jgi:hypothetical protein